MADCAVAVKDNADDNTPSDREHSGISAPQISDIVSQDLDKSATLKCRHQITGKIESPLEISCSE